VSGRTRKPFETKKEDRGRGVGVRMGIMGVVGGIVVGRAEEEEDGCYCARKGEGGGSCRC
jgi:hypothetical protein